MKKVFFVKKDGYKKTIEEVRTVMSKAQDKKDRPMLYDMSLWKDSF